MLITLLGLHILAAVFWVGGMAFAYMVLRPSAGPLDAPARLGLWRRVFGRFLPWVGASILVLLLSGYWMLLAYFGGFRGAPLYIHVMQGTGIVMMLLYGHLVAVPWKRFRTAVDGGALPEAARHLNQIRQIVLVNLILGVVTVLIGSTGRYW
jgi:uncharacterized membrane protein